MANKYYMRVTPEVAGKLDEYLTGIGCNFELLSRDIVTGKSSWLYSSKLSTEEVIMLRLKFPFIGFLDFTKALGRQIKQA
jgi:hypothetical protein